MANNTELNTGPFIWGAAQNAAGQPDDTIARTGPDISRETFMDDTFRAFMLLYRSGVWHKGMNADLLDGQHADEFQPICATLTALCALSSYGLVAKTAADTIAARTITASATAGREGIAITNGDGVSGNPEVGLNISGLTADTTLNATDEFPYRDATSEGNNKIDASNLAAQLAALGGYATTATAVTAASAFAAANRVIVADGADRSADDSDFTMSQNGSNTVDVASGTTFNIGGNVATSIVLGANTSVSGTLASDHTTVTATEDAAAINAGVDATDGPYEKTYWGDHSTAGTGTAETIIAIRKPAADACISLYVEIEATQSADASNTHVSTHVVSYYDKAGTLTYDAVVTSATGGTLPQTIAFDASGDDMRVRITDDSNVYRVGVKCRVKWRTTSA